MQKNEYTYLRFVRFKKLIQWDLKRYLNSSIQSKYETVGLKDLINEENKKYDISDKNSQYGILGVNNQTGIFDAYIESGANIKQKYKKMNAGWIAYNPYRINVGSIGIKTNEHKFDYISPAYVVFSCKRSIFPEYLFLTMKTPTFSKIIRDNTTGSVRQNLSYEVLKELSIPLPTIEKQQALVKTYNDKILKAETLEKQAEEIEQNIEDYLLTELGIEQYLETANIDKDTLKKDYKYLKFVKFKNIERWDCYNNEESSVMTKLKASSYPIFELGNVYKFIQRRWDKKEISFDYVEIGAVDPLKGILYAEKIQTVKAPSRATQKIKTGDLIIGTTRPYLKKFAIVTDKFNDCVCSSGFQVVAPKDTYNLLYLYEFLKSPIAISQFELFMSGALYPAITNKDLKKILIPLPPLKIQNAIIEHISEQKSQIKELRQQASELREKAKSDFEKSVFE